MPPKRLGIYRTPAGREPYREFLESIGDRRTAFKIEARVRRAALGNLGDHCGIGAGVIELRLHFGAGYRIYVGLEGQELIILLCGGDKSSQPEDIRRAIAFWADYRRLQ